jgi:hypothetical protein
LQKYLEYKNMRNNSAPMGFMGVLVMLSLATVSACTTTETVKLPPQELRQNIANGWVIDPGDSVTITTRDGTSHCCWVHSISSDSVVLEKSVEADSGFVTDHGIEAQKPELTSIPISDIVAVDKTELTRASKAGTATAGLAAFAGFWYLWLILPCLVVAAAI